MSALEGCQKAAISVSEMSCLCRLSRSRFHALVRAGVFPPPVVGGKRPHYTQELIKTCLEIRQTGIGQNGQVVLFNRPARKKSERKPTVPTPPPAEHTDLIEALRSLGLAATSDAVTAALGTIYPNGTAGTDQGEVVRRVFLHLQGRK
jgi:predicted DNA-binding transcriptional regulator AlpA